MGLTANDVGTTAGKRLAELGSASTAPSAGDRGLKTANRKEKARFPLGDGGAVYSERGVHQPLHRLSREGEPRRAMRMHAAIGRGDPAAQIKGRRRDPDQVITTCGSD